MVPVLLYGSGRDTAITNSLIRAFRAVHASVLHITSRTLSLMPTNAPHADFLLLDNCGVQDLQIQNGVTVFRPELSGFTEESVIPHDFVAVIDPMNEQAVAILKNRDIRTVTCGLSQKDTVTFSSLDPDRAVISLQREIFSFAGENVLPREIPVALSSPQAEYPLLASMAVLLLSGIPLSEEGLVL